MFECVCTSGHVRACVCVVHIVCACFNLQLIGCMPWTSLTYVDASRHNLNTHTHTHTHVHTTIRKIQHTQSSIFLGFQDQVKIVSIKQ